MLAIKAQDRKLVLVPPEELVRNSRAGLAYYAIGNVWCCYGKRKTKVNLVAAEQLVEFNEE